MKLRAILLRRNRDEILKTVLPPRIVTRVICRMSGEQRALYERECEQVLMRGNGSEGQLETLAEEVDLLCAQHALEGPAEQEESAPPPPKKARISNADTAPVVASLKCNVEIVLAKLLSLRQICSVPSSATSSKVPTTDVDLLLNQSVKLRVIWGLSFCPSLAFSIKFYFHSGY